MQNSDLLTQVVHVLAAEGFRAVDGVAEGDALSFADELVLDDVYRLRPDAERRSLTLALGSRLKNLRLCPGSELGRVGNRVYLDSCLTFMGQKGQTCEALVLVEVEEHMAVNVFVLPLSQFDFDDTYRLVGINRHAATKGFAEVACVSFAKGTHITLATGEQRRVEDLQVGDMILTRDAGPQPLRWLGHATLRATGDFAPVCIRAGAMANHADLRVSPDHRIMVYQRQDHLGAGQSEVLIKVRHLINDTTIVQETGGFIEYYQLLFDHHQIIYAEGLASESLRITPRTREAVPEFVAKRVLADAPSQASTLHLSYEVTEDLLSRPDALSLLRQASTS